MSCSRSAGFPRWWWKPASCACRVSSGEARTDVPEHEHHADDGPVLPPYRRSAIVDGRFAAVPSDENGVVGEPCDCPLTQHLLDRALHRAPRILVHDPEDLVERQPDGLIAPPQERTSDRVHHRDVPSVVRDDDSITHARQRDAETLLLLVGPRRCAFALTQAAARNAERGGQQGDAG